MTQRRGALKQNYHNKQNKHPCYPTEIKSMQQNWLVVSRAAPKEVCGYLLSHSTCNKRSTHSFIVREHWESVASWKKRRCTAPDMLLEHQKELTSCLHLHKERGLVWCQMAMCTDTEIMSWQPAGVKRSQITSFTLLSVGIEDSIYYFGNSQHHSCCRSHVRGAEGRQQKIIESWEPRDPLCKMSRAWCNRVLS